MTLSRSFLVDPKHWNLVFHQDLKSLHLYFNEDFVLGNEAWVKGLITARNVKNLKKIILQGTSLPPLATRLSLSFPLSHYLSNLQFWDFTFSAVDCLLLEKTLPLFSNLGYVAFSSSKFSTRIGGLILSVMEVPSFFIGASRSVGHGDLLRMRRLTTGVNKGCKDFRVLDLYVGDNSSFVITKSFLSSIERAPGCRTAYNAVGFVVKDNKFFEVLRYLTR